LIIGLRATTKNICSHCLFKLTQFSKRKENLAFTFVMLILDTDLYEPTLTALENFLPSMPKGAIVVLDEYNYQNFRGETQALKDYQAIGNFRLKRFRHDSCLAYFEV